MKHLLAWLLDLGYLVAGAASLPWLVYRLVRRGDARGLLSRLAIGPGARAASCIWLHGASAGEVLLLQPLVRRLERDLPEVPLVISAFSSTGLAAARHAFPRHTALLFPFDLSFVVNRFLRRLRPRLVVIAEGDLWPNFLLALQRREIPVAVVNGRMSRASCRRHALTRFVPSLIREMPVIAVQAEEHARRLRSLGVREDRIHVTGNMKYDLAPPSPESGESGALRATLGYGARDVVIIGGSLHHGEADALLRACRQVRRETQVPVALVLVPRYPADAVHVEREAQEHGLRSLRKTTLDGGRANSGNGEVLVVDTLGELRSLYAAADIAFVGGSLVSRGAHRGGHNLMEPATAGIPVLFGPHHSSFAETAEALVNNDGGVVVHTWKDLARHLLGLVEDAPARLGMGERARAAISSRRGATEKNYALLRPLLESDARRRSSPPFDARATGAAAGQDAP